MRSSQADDADSFLGPQQCDQHTAPADGPDRVGQGLEPLPEILVHRVRRRQHHVHRPRERDGEDRPARADAVAVGLDRISRDDANDVQVSVEHRVDDEERRPET